MFSNAFKTWRYPASDLHGALKEATIAGFLKAGAGDELFRT
jgi:hypothetical protein